MAEDKNAETIERLAFELFTARRASAFSRINAEQAVRESFRDAEAFAGLAKRIRGGESNKAPTGVQLSDACAPNLKPTHPVNLISQRFGNLDRVRKINDRLKDEIGRNEVAAELDWKESEINQAAALFPAYCSN